MQSLQLPSTFSKVHSYETQVPFPQSQDGETKDRGNINLSVCSEFTEYTAPIQPFGTCKALKLVSDTAGQAVVFAIDQNSRLQCLVHVHGRKHDWRMVDVTPGDFDKVVALDLIQDVDKNISMAIAAALPDGTCVVHHTSFLILEMTVEKDKVVGFAPHDITWTAVNNNEGSKIISYLLVGPKPTTSHSPSNFLITAGSKEQKDIAATHYTIDPSPGLSQPWKTFAFSRDADSIIQIQPATWENRHGIYVLFEQNNETECVVDLFNDDGSYSHTQILLTQECGNIRHMHSNLNPWGVTDLFFASENGLGFVNTNRDTGAVQLFAQGISFKQVVAAEATDPDNSDTQCKFTIFAVSDKDELHFITGTRQFKGNKVTFENSGFPIRTGVQIIAARVGEQTRTDDLIYLDDRGARVKQLMRDPVTTLWREKTLSFEAPSGATTFPAFVTTVSVKDIHSEAVGSGFPLEITSAPVHVTVNDRVCALSRQSTTFTTDALGQVTIVTPADDTLAAPVFEVTLRNGDKSSTNKVFAGQRVMERLGAFKSGPDLANAKAVDGTPVFSDIERQECSEGFAASGELLKSVPGMITNLDTDAKALVGDTAPLTEKVYAYDTADKAQQSSVADWISNAWTKTTKFIGDALEYLRSAVKATLKFAFKMVGKAIKFAFTIAGKAISFVIDTLDHFFPAFTSFLRHTIKTGMEKLVKLLGYRFDVTRIKQTQEVLIAAFSASKSKANTFMKVNKGAIRAGFDLARDTIDDYIRDDRPAPKADPGSKSILGWLFDNPIIKFLMRFNPFTVIIEAASEAMGEEFGEDFRFPDFSALVNIFTKALPEGIEEQIDNIMRLLDSFQTRWGSFKNNPASALNELRGLLGDIFWTLFDAIQSFILTLWEVLTLVFDQLFELLGGAWKIPGVTSVFESFTGQEFSLLNITSFAVAGYLNLFVGNESNLPFDVLGRPDLAINRIKDEDLDMRRVFKEAFGILSRGKDAQYPGINMYAAKQGPPSAKLATTNLATFGALNTNSNGVSNSNAKPSDHKRKEPDTKTPRDPANYKHAKAEYHSVKQSIATGVGLARAIAAIAEAPIAFTHAAPGQVGRGGVESMCHGVGICCTSLVAVARVVDFGYWWYIRGEDEDLKEELDEDLMLHLSGHIISIAGSIGSAACMFKALTEPEKEKAVAWNTKGNILLNITCGIDVVTLHLIAEWHEDSKSASSLRVADWTELVACVLGTVTVGTSWAGRNAEAQPKQAFEAVAVGSAFFDAILSIVSLVITITNASANSGNDH